jgi:glycosyltransferase involved in cell wall biosynthesis
MPAISVVIPVHNAEATLGEQLEALHKQAFDGDWEVLVVDNRSTDASAEIARSFESVLPLRVHAAPARSSAAYARNVGVSASSGDLIVFLDADDVADPGLLAAYAGADGFNVMGGRLDDERLNDPVTASWRYPLTAGGLPVALGRFPFFVGANCAVRRRAFERIGGFDETLAFVGEEVDFSIRAQLAGIEVGWVPEAIVHYRHRPSLGALARQSYVYGRGSVVLYERYRDVAAPDWRVPRAVRQISLVLLSVPNLVRGRSRRGQWIRWAGFVAGQTVESLRRRVLYVG